MAFVAIIIIFILILLPVSLYLLWKNPKLGFNDSDEKETAAVTKFLDPKTVDEMHPPGPEKDFNDSYALADRIENLLYSRGVSPEELAEAIGVAPRDVQRYCHMKGSPPPVIVNAIENYFGVRFEYLAECKGSELTVFKNEKWQYTKKFNYPHKPRFDVDGNCIFLESVDNSRREQLCHLTPQGNVKGCFSGFPPELMRSLKISLDGAKAVLVSEKNRILLLNLRGYELILNKILGFHNFNIKDITPDELIFRFICAGDMIDFSLDYEGNLSDATTLAAYFVSKKPPILYHSEGYVIIINYLLQNFSENEELILPLYSIITRPAARKYIKSGTIAAISKGMGVGYFDLGNYMESYKFFKKALEDNPKIAVKSYLNKLEKILNTTPREE